MVVRTLLLVCVLVGSFARNVAAQDIKFPSLSGRVVDQAGVLDPQTEKKLSGVLEAHERKTSNQVVVVTLKSLQGYSIERFGVDLGRHWGIGQKDHNNGVLFIIAPNERKTRIEVGYGLEGVLTDALARTILDNQVLPHFKSHNMSKGIVLGSQAIVRVLETGNLGFEVEKKKRPANGKKESIASVIITAAFVFFFLGNAVFFLLGGYGSGRRHDGWGGGFGSGSSGGFGGGGFSGGGGSFGGGGASGGW